MTAESTTAAASPWPAHQTAIARFLADLIGHELARLRPAGAPRFEGPWLPGLRLDEQGLGLDSLERLAVASALEDVLQPDQDGGADRLLQQRRFGEWVGEASAVLALPGARLTFRTSGSQGAAKPCTHALADLQQEVDHLASLWTGPRRILSAVPAHHIYGFLCTVLLPDRHGAVEVRDIRQATPQGLARLLQPGDLVVSHPAHWAVVARHSGRLPPDVHGVTSTAPCPDDVAQRLGDLGLATLTQLYGSSETAGIATRTAAGAPFELMPFWSRDAGADHRLLRASADGSVRAHDLQDAVAWHDDRWFTLGDRLDGAVQVGGTNVFPARVRQVLLAHPDVADAAVRPMRRAEGSRLKAFVVHRPGADVAALQSGLWAWTDARLSTPERPKAFTFGGALPRNAMGKLSDWPLDAAGPAVDRAAS